MKIKFRFNPRTREGANFNLGDNQNNSHKFQSTHP